MVVKHGAQGLLLLAALPSGLFRAVVIDPELTAEEARPRVVAEPPIPTWAPRTPTCSSCPVRHDSSCSRWVRRPEITGGDGRLRLLSFESLGDRPEWTDVRHVLVRKDGHVAWISDSMDIDPSVLAPWLGGARR